MAKTNKRKAKQKAAAAAAMDESRRGFLSRMKWYALGAGVIGAGGYFSIDSYAAFAAERDLTKIGKGAPKIVQIHDPQCPLCNALMKEARAALENCADDAPCFLVADIRTPKGRDFANVHGVGNVTVMLLDGRGGVVEVLQGQRGRSELAQRFKALARST